MRIAALIFGLVAGLLGGAAIVWGGLDSDLAAAAFGGHHETIARFVLYLIPNIGLLGAGLALARPGFGALLLLLSALGWVFVALVAGHGAVVYAALPFTFALAGVLVALSGRRQAEPEEIEPEAPRAASLWSDEVAEEPPSPRPPRRGARPAPPPPPPRNEPVEEVLIDDFLDEDEPQPESYDDDVEADEDPLEAEPEFEDEIVEAEAEAEEEQAYEDEENQVGGTDGEYDFDFTPDDRRPPPRRAVPAIEEQDDEPSSPRRKSAPPAYAAARQQRPPARRQAAASTDFELSPDDFSPSRRGYEPTPTRGGYRDLDAYAEEPPPPRRRRGLMSVVNVVIALVILGGIAGFVYYDYQRGAQSLLFGSHPAGNPPVAGTPALNAEPAPAPVSQTPAPTPSPETSAATAPGAPPDAPPTATAAASYPTVTATPEPAAAPEPAPAPTPPVAATPAPAPAPVQIASAPEASTVFNDPFKYCGAIVTADAPDSSFTGPSAPPAIVAALHASDPSQVHWRCVNRVVLGCNANGGAACDLTPTVELMVNYCAAHPDTPNIPAPNGSWSCNGKHPVIPDDQQWPVDARGFYPGAWKEVPAPPAAG